MSRYLDHAATSPLSNSVLGRLDELYAMYYNPSSAYEAGAYNMMVVENVRNKIAKEINAKPSEIIFTSCGSEANALAIDGFLKANKEYSVVCSNIEHSSILNNKNISSVIKCNNDGFINPKDISEMKNTLISIMMINNEIGSTQPIKEIVDIAHKNGNIVMTDAVQAFGKVPIDVKYLGVDMLSASGHKIGSTRGVGFLYVKEGINIEPIVYGAQEDGMRGGTYNDFAIKTLGLAIDDIDYRNDDVLRARRNFLINKLLEIKGIHLNGSAFNRSSSNINMRIDNISIDSQQLVALLDEAGFQVSAGSACHSGDPKPSYVLKAIGLTDEEAMSSIRITIGIENSVRDLEDFVNALNIIIDMYKN